MFDRTLEALDVAVLIGGAFFFVALGFVLAIEWGG